MVPRSLLEIEDAVFVGRGRAAEASLAVVGIFLVGAVGENLADKAALAVVPIADARAIGKDIVREETAAVLARRPIAETEAIALALLPLDDGLADTSVALICIWCGRWA